MKSLIVVMGGSFNPPTRAHLHLMEAAIKVVDACQGVFVPTGHEYVAKKMKRQRCPQDTLSESIRLAMLESFREADSRISVSRGLTTTIYMALTNLIVYGHVFTLYGQRYKSSFLWQENRIVHGVLK